jgi:deoxyribonuclease I
MRYIYLIFILLFSQLHAGTREELAEQVTLAHKPLLYKDVKLLMFKTVDNIDGEVCSAYTPSQCQNRHFESIKSLKDFNLNIEHTWPQSKGAKKFPAVSDMHHLFVTSKESNSKRANHPFCNVYGIDWQQEGSLLGYDENIHDCFEPQNKHKGNVARAMFYFSVRYKFSIDSSQEQVLRQWHLLDPVDDKEIKRNLVIEKLQGNSNPFILRPELVERISDF